MIQAVLYDLGDIFFEAHYWRKWMWEYFKDKSLFNGEFHEFYFLYEDYLSPVYEGKKDYLNAFHLFIDKLGIENRKEFEKLSFEKKSYYENNRKLFSGVKETLAKLIALKIKNVIITDNENDSQYVRKKIIKRFDITNYIDHIYTSKDFKMKKPNPKLFYSVLNDLELNKENIVFVGHDIDELNGVKKMGIKTIEYNNYLGLKTNADICINEFSELYDIVESLNISK